MSVAINSSLAGALNNQGSWKRKTSDDEDERRGDNVKRAKYSWYVTLESESPVPTDEDEESICTAQGNETEFARDTSDTSTHTWVSSSESDVSVHVEYELDSRSENENPFMELSSSSEPENIVAVEFITFCDSEGLADDSDASSFIDSDIKKADFRICVQCKNPNKNSMYRYCEKCYQMKKTYFPRSRPKRKPRAQKSASERLAMTSTCSTTSTQELSEMDSGLASSQCDSGIASSQDLTDRVLTDSQSSDLPLTDSQSTEFTATFDSQNSETTTVTYDSQSAEVSRTRTTTRYTVVSSQAAERDEVDSGNAPTECDSDEHSSASSSSSNELKSTKDKGKKSDAESSSPKEDPKTILLKNLQSRRKNEQSTPATESLCNICIEKPKNGVFVHGRTTHRCCCYKCAMKVWITNDHRCPICNRKVTQVLKDFCV